MNNLRFNNTKSGAPETKTVSGRRLIAILLTALFFLTLYTGNTYAPVQRQYILMQQHYLAHTPADDEHVITLGRDYFSRNAFFPNARPAAAMLLSALQRRQRFEELRYYAAQFEILFGTGNAPHTVANDQ